MTVLPYVLGAAALVAGIAGLVLPVLPGSLLLVAGVVLIAWAENFTRVGWGTVAFAAVIGVLMWLVDLAAAALGAKAFGASRRSILGASVGLLVGLFLGPAGVVLGPIVGAVVFELTRNPDLRAAGRAGAGAFVGFVLGNAVKIALAFVLVGVVVLALVV
ncbi:DUF456 domain-containing protein [Anaeromyxobacter terrae]|uniref:DUF456 domain-containing protein n=1 Tax=Anaeromyxobacter terrae TaxID=2925406 RepID=UPI001F581DF6|nr:DUF456 domain-containing protein [Anaeromyxobacter sp. SG22]